MIVILTNNDFQGGNFPAEGEHYRNTLEPQKLRAVNYAEQVWLVNGEKAKLLKNRNGELFEVSLEQLPNQLQLR